MGPLEVELQFIWQALYFAQQIILHNFTFPACGLWTSFLSLSPFGSRKSSSQRKITWSAVVHSCSHHFKSIPRRGWKCECMHVLKLSRSVSRPALYTANSSIHRFHTSPDQTGIHCLFLFFIFFVRWG